MEDWGHRDCMKFNIKLFRAVGCWPQFKNKKKKSEQLYFYYSAFIIAILTVYFAILTYGLWKHLEEWTSMEEAVEEIIVFSTGLIVLFKLALIIWNQIKLQEIIDYINNDLNVREITNEEDGQVIRECLKHEKSLTKIYVSSGYVVTFLYTTSSIIRIFQEKSRTAEQYTLPLKYPFYPKEFPMYHFTYFHQMCVMVLNGHIGTSVDSFFSSLTYFICGHFEIVKNRIAKENGIITKKFVLYHEEIIRLVNKLQSIFGPFLTFQLMANSFLLCLGLLLITQTANITVLQYTKCVMYTLIKLTQLFLYCWYGQEIIQKSSAISNEVYFGKWHEFEKKETINNLQMVLRRSQKPVKMKAGIYFVLSLPTLATVVNTAYSFFTMVKSTKK